MNMIFLVLQGFLMGHVAGLAFNGYEDPQFWAVLIGNSHFQKLSSHQQETRL